MRKNLRPFEKGRSGNPGGRPKIPPDLVEIAKGKSKQALGVLVSIMQDKSVSPSVRVQAAEAILNRGYGKPSQYLDIQAKQENNGPSGTVIILPEKRRVEPDMDPVEAAAMYRRIVKEGKEE